MLRQGRLGTECVQTGVFSQGSLTLWCCGLLQVRDRLSSRVDASSSKGGSVSMSIRTQPQEGMSTLMKYLRQHYNLCDGHFKTLLAGWDVLSQALTTFVRAARE